MMLKKVLQHCRWQILYAFRILLPQYFLSLFLPKKVLTGPFAGLKYLRKSTGSVVLPKLIGTYEDELHDLWNKISKSHYYRFVDIGAAEGYYAVGVTKFLLPRINEVIAFESTLKGRRLIKKLAKLNGVANVIIKGYCDQDSLNNILDNRKTLILVDIEGEEYSLLNPTEISFRNCDILVELHNNDSPYENQMLKQKFSNTHEIITIHKANLFRV